MLTRDNKLNVLASRQSSGNVIECPGCGNVLPAQYFEVDHIVPLSKGGSDEISNCMLLCVPCNRSKGNSLTLEELQTKNISSRKMYNREAAIRSQQNAYNAQHDFISNSANADMQELAFAHRRASAWVDLAA